MATHQLPLYKSPLIDPSVTDHSEHGLHAEPHHEISDDGPHFHRESETDDAELFYDLFFVANLTVFTAVHDINNTHTLAQYIGIFCILWFTWYQVGLYDVRFCMDSLIERVAKAFQFGVMIGFSAIGPQFNVGELEDEYGLPIGFNYYQALTLILMGSRIILVIQYLQTIFFLRKFEKTKLPLVIIAVTYALAATAYFGLYWSFKPGMPNWTYVAWYVIGILETFFATTVSSLNRALDFRGTHLVQRMGLLTLIILGEGVMGIAKQVQMIVKSKLFWFENSVVGNIVAGVLILYFMYMLYFDWIEEQEFGSVRQQVWAALHFPLHLALVLAVEGINQCIAWRAAVVEMAPLEKGFGTWWQSETTPEQDFQFAEDMNYTSQTIIADLQSNTKSLAATYNTFNDRWLVRNCIPLIKNTQLGDDYTYIAGNNATVLLWWIDYRAIFTLAGFYKPNLFEAKLDWENPESFHIEDWAVSEQDEEEMKSVDTMFTMTFIYLFISVGMVVIVCTLIAALSKTHKQYLHWIRLGFSCLVGIFLCLFVLLAVGVKVLKESSFQDFALSPWILPLIAVSLLAVVILNNVKPIFPKLSRPRKSSQSREGEAGGDQTPIEPVFHQLDKPTEKLDGLQSDVKTYPINDSINETPNSTV